MERETPVTIGPSELAGLSRLNVGVQDAPTVPFSAEVLAAHAQTHVLIFTPKTFADGTPITLIALREKFGVDPTKSEPCFYNQDWYVQEDFAMKTALDGQWHLIAKNVLEEARAKRPEQIEATLSSKESFPTAVTSAFAFFAYWLMTGEVLWKYDFVWNSDVDHNGDRIYTGRYEDPTGINKKGFNVHRHLALRQFYSAAPEIKP